MAGQPARSPEYHPQPDSQENPELQRQAEKETTKFHGSKRCGNRSAYLGPARCAYSAYRGRRRSRTWQSQRGAPQASPLVYTVQETDPRQGLRCLRCGPSHAPYPGSPILLGAPTPSPAPHPLAMVTSLGWRPACRVGPCDTATLLGLVGGEPWRPGLHRSLAHGPGTAVLRGPAGVPPALPHLLRGCRLAAPLCRSPPPLRWGFRFWRRW